MGAAHCNLTLCASLLVSLIRPPSPVHPVVCIPAWFPVLLCIGRSPHPPTPKTLCHVSGWKMGGWKHNFFIAILKCFFSRDGCWTCFKSFPGRSDIKCKVLCLYCRVIINIYMHWQKSVDVYRHYCIYVHAYSPVQHFHPFLGHTMQH